MENQAQEYLPDAVRALIERAEHSRELERAALVVAAVFGIALAIGVLGFMHPWAPLVAVGPAMALVAFFMLKHRLAIYRVRKVWLESERDGEGAGNAPQRAAGGQPGSVLRCDCLERWGAEQCIIHQAPLQRRLRLSRKGGAEQ